MVRFLGVTLLILVCGTLSAQKFELIIGLGPTYSITSKNISYEIAPNFFPVITLEDGRNPNMFKTKSIDWINDRNYFGLEPSFEFGYRTGKKLTLGLGFLGRRRQIEYELFLPALDGLALYSHQFELDYTFLASTLYLKYRDPDNQWNVSLHLGFNHSLNSLEDEGRFNSIINNYNIIEDVVGPVKSSHGLLDFTNYPLWRLSFNKILSRRFELGLILEKQFKNYYGSDIRIIDVPSNQYILVGHVYGNDLTVGVKLSYNIFSR